MSEEKIQSYGSTFSGDLMVPLPPPGVHMWVVPAYFLVNMDEDREDLPDGDYGMHLTFGKDTLAEIGSPGCNLCEHAYEDAKDIPCPGKPQEDA